MTNGQVLVEDFGLVAWPSAFPFIHVAGVLAFGVAGIVLWLVTQRRTKVHPDPRRLPAHIIAREAIKRLNERGYIEQAACEPFFLELSAIVRRYIVDRFDVDAPDLTTEEFIETARHSKRLSAGQHELIREFLEQSDLVKFARAQPEGATMERALEAAIRLIVETQEKGTSKTA